MSTLNVTFDFSGRVAILTGATGGIGRQTARQLHEAGAGVVLLDLNEAALQELADELGDGAPVRTVAGDSGAPENVAAAIAAAKELGGVDFVIPAAGIYPESSVLETSDELWRRVQSINLEAVFRLVRAALPEMKAGSSIVAFASVAGHRGSKNHAHYAASKAGILAFVRSLAHEVGPEGIRANAVSPGTIETPMTIELLRQRGEQMLVDTPLRRHGKPAEVASVILFLLSDAAGFVTGETIHVNGGLFMAG